ncbi:flagellar hook-associated protein FlgL [Erwinia pyrifoliae]|uniref:Flagellar hook-associated protein FlgL n=1 Tax=Erwinia pyrifoliae TaxID=79967 RepID=A0ABY5XD81_ERWPY|nr:flagellar hook-associated protein FlgL [Erwinia pyrifoliae]AUX73473.1 flagellar hook-associated protein 3 [Erwinia pyrifoliae]MCA8876226.1 flagellar hook-associated protein 3 [Erwinia pyrifoliae]UWS31784.1 flagellar hook-associated protein FlgL [Erwinia pyrifoliae]UWS35368.1 flagellar hook-associated protein FlgL [Erwinia pyrifoliae]UXK14209.1 flagellar hook-associated protein FlgL [Erwinia pyrifoliae]
MRLSTQYMYKQNMESMSAQMTQNHGLFSRISAGKTLLAASDNPGGAADAVILQNALAKMELYKDARSGARSGMEQEDSTLSSVGKLLTKNLSEKLVAAMNGTLSEEDRAVLGQEIEGISKNLLDLANTRDGSGRYVFSGFKTGTAAFDEQGNYQGGDTAIHQTVADGSDMQISHLGSDIFMSGTSSDLFKNLQSAASELTKSPLDEEQLKLALGAASKAVDAGIDRLGKVQADLGTQLQQLDALDIQADNDFNSIVGKLQSVLGADTSTQINLIQQTKMAEVVMEASMKVFQSMQKMSLFRS